MSLHSPCDVRANFKTHVFLGQDQRTAIKALDFSNLRESIYMYASGDWHKLLYLKSLDPNFTEASCCISSV